MPHGGDQQAMKQKDTEKNNHFEAVSVFLGFLIPSSICKTVAYISVLTLLPNLAWKEMQSQETVKYLHLEAESNSQGGAQDKAKLI